MIKRIDESAKKVQRKQIFQIDQIYGRKSKASSYSGNNNVGWIEIWAFYCCSDIVIIVIIIVILSMYIRS